MSSKNWTWSQSYKENARGACRQVEAGPTGHPVPGLYLLPGTLTSHGRELGTHPQRAGKLTFSQSFFTGCQGSHISPRAPRPLPPLSFHV